MQNPMHSRRLSVPVGLWLALAASAPLSAADGSWLQTAAATYSWDTSGNWTGGTIADGSGFTATFSSGTTGTQTVTLDSDRTIGNLSFTNHAWILAGPGKLTLAGSSTPTISGPTQTATISAVIDGTQGVTTTGTVIFSGANTYSGTTTVSTSRLTLNNNSALGTSNVTVTSGAQLTVANGITITGRTATIAGGGGDVYGALTGSGTSEWAGGVLLGSSARIGTSNNTSQFTVSGVISNGTASNLFISGLGTTVLSGANTYTGNTQVYRGTLKLDAGNNRLPTGTALTIGGTADNAIFDLNGWSQTVASLASGIGAGAQTLTNSSSTASVFTVNGTATTAYSGAVTGNLSLVKSGSGTLTLSGTTHTFSGGITVNAGTLGLAGAFINDTASVSLFTGSTLNLNYVGTDSIGALYFNNVLQASGTYGAIGSGAQFETAFITGAGLLSFAAVPEPSTFAALAGASTLACVVFRRRRVA